MLEELALDYPLPKVIMQHRGLAKLKSTYTDKLPRLLNKATGRVHTSYHQAVTATGRLSSSDPNLQNIPIRTEEGRKIRQAFIARPGYCIVAADYCKLSCALWRISPKIKGYWRHLPKGVIFTRPLRQRSLALRLIKCRVTSDAAPKRSISGSSMA
ncbi:hypothetical protein HSBAA_54390 [Vreelandella sulfidaeris]|uniref:DNA-directed DNA polymerase n=1 Tax=Vreelandella sulfidaeris TaxID=115553 RepID=A0A455UFN3_9GAMM|nr:hypothetical protein HSBAA_54390 [Halomonas sulfidaeris]